MSDALAWVVQHVAREGQPDEDTKLIGVYSSVEAANAAVARTAALPGFRDSPTGFHVDQYRIDEDGWTEGFTTDP